MLLFMNTLMHTAHMYGIVVTYLNTTTVYGYVRYTYILCIFFQRYDAYFINILHFPEYYSPDVWKVME